MVVALCSLCLSEDWQLLSRKPRPIWLFSLQGLQEVMKWKKWIEWKKWKKSGRRQITWNLNENYLISQCLCLWDGSHIYTLFTLLIWMPYLSMYVCILDKEMSISANYPVVDYPFTAISTYNLQSFCFVVFISVPSLFRMSRWTGGPTPKRSHVVHPNLALVPTWPSYHPPVSDEIASFLTSPHFITQCTLEVWLKSKARIFFSIWSKRLNFKFSLRETVSRPPASCKKHSCHYFGD